MRYERTGVAPPTFEVRPVRPDACPITVQVDHHQQLSLFMSPPTWCETWHPERASYLLWVREAVEAVTQGRYEEWLDDDGRRAMGTFHLPRGPESFSDNMVRRGAGTGPGWRHRIYAPYPGAPEGRSTASPSPDRSSAQD